MAILIHIVVWFIGFLMAVNYIWPFGDPKDGVAFFLGYPVLAYIHVKAIEQRSQNRAREKATEAAAAARLKAQKEEEAKQRKLEAERVRNLPNVALTLCKEALAEFESAARALSSAQTDMRIARRKLEENAALPFWLSIESSAKQLGSFHEAIHSVRGRTLKYEQIVTELGKHNMKALDFPVTVNSATAMGIANDLRRSIAIACIRPLIRMRKISPLRSSSVC